MDFKRLLRHMVTTRARMQRAFTAAILEEVKQAIAAVERSHRGELRFVVEAALDPARLLHGVSPRERALEVFSALRVWDTQDNSGVLVYVLLADHAIEIVADRGIHALSGPGAWQPIVQAMQAAFLSGDYRGGALQGVQAVAAQLRRHVPAHPGSPGELPDDVALL